MVHEHTLHGVIVPIVTPFDRRGNLDIKSFKGLVARLKKSGIHGLVINGTVGESSAVEEEELEDMIGAARGIAGEIPLIVGIGSEQRSAVIQKIAWIKSLGADAALVTTPCRDRPSQQIIEYFLALAEANFPVILHDISFRAAAPLDLHTVDALLGMEHIIGLIESSGDIKRLYKLARTLTKPVLCGEDELFFASLCCGSKGGVLVSANLESEQWVQVYELFRQGKIETAHKQFDRLTPLIQFLFSEPGPAPLKWLLAQHGHIRSDRLRLPMPSMVSSRL